MRITREEKVEGCFEKADYLYIARFPLKVRFDNIKQIEEMETKYGFLFKYSKNDEFLPRYAYVIFMSPDRKTYTIEIDSNGFYHKDLEGNYKVEDKFTIPLLPSFANDDYDRLWIKK